jgi:hypothetical protein
MKLRLSVFVDAFLGSGVPLGGDPITTFQNVPLLGLRTATVVDNCRPSVGDVVKGRFIATNCGQRRIELVFPGRGDGRERDRAPSEDEVRTLLAGESVEYLVFRKWDAPGEYPMGLGYEARCIGQPFARLQTPVVAVQVRPAQAERSVEGLWAERLQAEG